MKWLRALLADVLLTFAAWADERAANAINGPEDER